MTARPGIKLRYGGRESSFSPGSTVIIGRDPSVDVRMTNSYVSKRHAKLTLENGTWVLEDTNSRRGIHHQGGAVSRLRIDSLTEVWIGPPNMGERLELIPQEIRLSGTDETIGRTSPDTIKPVGRSDGHAIRLRMNGQDYVFPPDRVIRIGRDPNADVTSENRHLSRRHATIHFQDDQWILEDNSSRGTFHEASKITTLPITAATKVWLAAPGEGDELEMIPVQPRVEQGVSRFSSVIRDLKRSTRRTVVIASSAVLLMAALVAAFLMGFIGPGGDAGTGSPDLTALKQAAVRISEARTVEEIQEVGWGSGSIIDVDGRKLILTNAHVVAPEAPGLRPLYREWVGDPVELYTIFTYDGDDQPAKPTYLARPVVADGWMDLAFLEIVQTADGQSVDSSDLDLPSISIGDSESLSTGDDIYVLGFPGITRSDAVDVQQGQFASPEADPVLQDPRGWLNVSGAVRVTPGNSGGMAVDSEGRLVGVPSRGGPDPGGSGESLGQLRPVHLLQEGLLDAAVSGGTYDQFRYVTRPTGEEVGEAAGWTIASDDSEQCIEETVTSAGPDTGVAAQFAYSGVSPGQHVFFEFSGETEAGTGRVHEVGLDWPSELGTEGCVAIQMAPEMILDPGTYTAQFRIGPSYETVLAEQTITIGAEEAAAGEDTGETGETEETSTVAGLEQYLESFPQCTEPVTGADETVGFGVQIAVAAQKPHYQWACIWWSDLVVNEPYPINDDGTWWTPAQTYPWLLANVELTEETQDALQEFQYAWEDLLAASMGGQ